MATNKRNCRRSSTSFIECLSQWSELQNADQLVVSMCDKLEEFKNFLAQDEIEEKCFPALVRVICLASQSDRNHGKFLSVLNTLCQSLFLTQHINLYSEKVHDQLGWKQCQALIIDIIHIFKLMLQELPNFAFKVRVAAARLNYLINQLDTIPDKARLLNLLATISEEALTVSSCGEASKTKHNQFIQHSDTDEPPESFLEISIVPTANDLFQKTKPFVRKAKRKGPYRDVQHYLDVQFRLMKLDFMTPLKQGLQQLRNQKDKNRFKCPEIRLYHDVRFIKSDLRKGYNHVLQFDTQRLARVDWENTDRLMTGSLVCLSKDGFKTIIIATVFERNMSDQDEQEGIGGRVLVNVKLGLEYLLESTIKDVFIMAESTTFYDPYFHVLESLKTMTNDFPLMNVLIHCKPALRPPEYLLTINETQKIPTYDISCLMVNPKETKVPVLTTVKWPEASLMCLNQSQRDAAILALTKEVCLIQGPPGTGKTYVGLKVVQTLLMNKEHMFSKNDPSRRASPILVVCFTNHALDQFLEGIRNFCPDGIARIGGGCKTETLKQCIVKVYPKRLTSFETSDYKGEMYSIHKKISSFRREIQRADELRKFMLDTHYNFLKNKKLCLTDWLNAPKNSPSEGIEKQLEQLFTKLVLKWKYRSTQVKLTEDMNVCDRCSLYFSKIKQVRHNLDIEKHHAKRDRHQIQKMEFQETLDLSYTEILPDETIDKCLKQFFSEKVKQTLKSAGIAVPKKNIIRFWLLGQYRRRKGQLQEIQTLSHKLGKRLQQRSSRQADTGKHSRQELCFESTICDDPDDDLLDVLRQLDELQFGVLEESVASIGETHTDSEGWQKVSYLPKYSFAQVVRLMSSTEPMSCDEETAITDLTELGLKQKYALYMLWVKRYREYLKEKLIKCVDLSKPVFGTEDNEWELKSKRVIGMTTTGAAKYHQLLEKVGCSIVIVEEAAEVLESHVITALSRNCKHLILIGDHQQLRPKPATFELERNFNLDVSLFERLILNEIPYVTLKIQHRMRPEVSQIIRLIYPELEDHGSVCTFEHIRGVSQDVFFIDHTEHEVSDSESLSKSNEHEALYVTALCQYLTRQDYPTSQITILTTYKGQATLIRKYTKSRNLEVRVSVVDDFQGEENEIIILSLVRSNEEDIAGFVKIDNRVCVALSRAKKGFFVIGNFDLLKSKSKLWRNIIQLARKNDMFGEGLPVHCYQHPEATLKIKTASDFEKRPEGGCGAPCMTLLDCGHSCQRTCHGYDLSHRLYTCKMPCVRKCIEGHPCPLPCSKTCQCEVLVSKTLPECKHGKEMACYKSPESEMCLARCGKSLSCGHLCQDQCQICLSLGKHKKCGVKMDYIFQPCGHKGQVDCFQLETNVLCEVLCPAKLSCGHAQQIPCHLSPEEAKCTEKCPAIFSCGHSCTGVCTKALPCGHSCTEKCPGILACGHPCTGVCTKALPCGHSCTETCPEILACGHPCTGRCSDCARNNKHTDCKFLVDYIYKPCGHSGKVPCFESSKHIDCKEPCTLTLKCGHPCRGTCSGCLQGRVHQACVEHCTLPLPCGHICQGFCSSPCLPCEMPCLYRCRHRSCSSKKKETFCGELCTPCDAKCMQKCKHFVNLKLCSDHWDHTPCREPCTKRLKLYFPGKRGGEGTICEHMCSGICGEMCVCSICETPQPIKSEGPAILVDKEKGNLHKENGLKFYQQTTNATSRLILKLPNCGHIFYVDELDVYVDKKNQSHDSSFISCPVCPKPMLNCVRYDRINLQRFNQRNMKKLTLLKNNSIPQEHKEKIKLSAAILRNVEESKDVEEVISALSEVSNQTEYQTISLKIKFLYAVSLLDFKLKGIEFTSHRATLRRLIASSLRFTKQFQRELKQEVTRSLQINTLAALENICPRTVFENVTSQLNEVKDGLRGAGVDPDVHISGHDLIQRLSEEMSTSYDEHSLESQRILETYRKVVKVLSSNTQDTLEDILHPSRTALSFVPKTISQEFHYFQRLRSKKDAEDEKTMLDSESKMEQLYQRSRFSSGRKEAEDRTTLDEHRTTYASARPARFMSSERLKPGSATARKETPEEREKREAKDLLYLERKAKLDEQLIKQRAKEKEIEDRQAKQQHEEGRQVKSIVGGRRDSIENTSSRSIRNMTANSYRVTSRSDQRSWRATEETARDKDRPSLSWRATEETARDMDRSSFSWRATEETARDKDRQSLSWRATEETASDKDRPSFSSWSTVRQQQSKEK